MNFWGSPLGRDAERQWRSHTATFIIHLIALSPWPGCRKAVATSSNIAEILVFFPVPLAVMPKGSGDTFIRLGT